MREADLTSKDLDELACVSELMDREWSPCRWNCPVHADVRSYIEAAAQGRLRDAIDIVRENLPFAAVCGRVCHHPCETNCRRDGVDDPVAIREVKRFVAEHQGADGATVYKADVQDKARVAIVGSGPAGMSAALDLAKLGYRPMVFEKFPVAGGIPATAIPRYRMPLEVTRIDIDWICAHGVGLTTGVEIGRDKTINDLLAGEFDAVLLAAGMADSRPLPLPGDDHRRVLRALEFLTATAFEKPVDIGSQVLVIGGGNVACDCARSAVRLGADVTMMCLESADEMPAWDWEVDETVEEGVAIIHRRGPVEILREGDRIVGVRTRAVTRVFDENERFSPQYSADLTDVACDTVIIAIGQMANMGFAEGSKLEVSDRGRMTFNAATHQTNVANVFACGEIVTPPGSVVEACASGRRAAKAIDLFLRGERIEIDDTQPPAIDVIPPETAEKVLKVVRQPVPTDPPADRIDRFTEFEHSYDISAALREARRCMNCGAGAEVLVDKCAACLTCLRVCPFGVPVVTDVARIESEKCQSCGICIAECPANAIVPRCREFDDLGQLTAAALAKLDGGRKVVAYICGHHAAAADWTHEADDGVPGVAEIYLGSTSRISAAELLAAMEIGADAVIVVAAPDGSDRYPQVAHRTRLRVAQAREMLAEVGLAADALQLFEIADQDRAAIVAKLAEAAAP